MPVGSSCRYPAQIVTYQKFVGQLVDAGNTTTIAHYLDLLSQAFLLAPVLKWSTRPIRQRSSSPKLVILNNALASASAGKDPADARSDAGYFGHLAENAIGSHLINAGIEVFYWRERDLEVDFVARHGGKILALEVTAGHKPVGGRGLAIFLRRYPGSRALRIGGQSADISLEQALRTDPRELFTGFLL